MIDEKLKNDKFILKHRIGKKSFTQNRTLNFRLLFWFICRTINKRIQSELDVFFSELGHVAKLGRKLSAAAFSKAREKLSYEAFKEISSALNRQFYDDFHTRKFYGLRLLAFDGSILTLPRTELTIEEFGDNVLSSSGKWIKAQVSVLFDVVNNVCIASEIGPYKEAEYLQAERLLANVGKGDLLLFDRGYFGRNFLWKVYQTGANFCFRVQTNACREVQDFIANKYKDKDVTIHTEKGNVTVRITRVTLDIGEYEYLVTNLFARHVYTSSVLKKIYHMRWGVEEYYKDMKHAVCVENFAGKKPNSIKQEFYANIITYNLAMMSFSDSIERKANKGKRSTGIRQTNEHCWLNLNSASLICFVLQFKLISLLVTS